MEMSVDEQIKMALNLCGERFVVVFQPEDGCMECFGHTSIIMARVDAERLEKKPHQFVHIYDGEEKIYG